VQRHATWLGLPLQGLAHSLGHKKLSLFCVGRLDPRSQLTLKGFESFPRTLCDGNCDWPDLHDLHGNVNEPHRD